MVGPCGNIEFFLRGRRRHALEGALGHSALHEASTRGGSGGSTAARAGHAADNHGVLGVSSYGAAQPLDAAGCEAAESVEAAVRRACLG